MKKMFVLLACALASFASVAAEMTEEQKTVYAIGLVLGKQIAPFSFSPAEMELFKKGLSDANKSGKPSVDVEAYMPKIQALVQQRSMAMAAKQAEAGKAYADKAAQEKGAVKTASGLVFIPLKEGTGATPAAADTVKVHYRGTLIDGTEFDSSYKRNEPAEFPLNGVIKCWGEGVQKIKVGGKARLVCPAAIAYGEQGAPGGKIPPGATLNFEVELLSIKAAPKAPAPAASAPVVPAPKK